MADLKLTVDVTELTTAIRTTDQTRQAIRFLGQQFARSNDQSAYLRGINQIANAQKNLKAEARMSRSEIMQLGAQFRQQSVFADQLAEAQRRAAQATQMSSRGLARSGLVMQQTGYQVGDFLVQVQSGTNAFVAFGQQATQLAGLLTLSMNPALVALGVGLSIAIPLTTAIAGYFSRTGSSARDAADDVETLEERIRSLDSTLRDYLRTREAAREGITVEELLGTESLEDAERNLASARVELQRVVDVLSTPMGISIGSAFSPEFLNRVITRSDEYQNSLARLIEAENRVALLRERQGQVQFQTFQERLTQYQEEIELQRTIQQFGENSDQARQVRLEQAIAAERRRIDALREANELTEAQALALQRAAEEAITLSQVDMASGIAAAAGSAAELANNLGISVQAAQALQALSDSPNAPMSAQPRRLMATGAFAAGPAVEPYAPEGAGAPLSAQPGALGAMGAFAVPTGAGRRAGGGGGSGADMFRSRIEGIRELQSAIQAAQRETQLFEQEISLLDTALEEGIINQQRYNELVAAAESAYGRAQQGAYDYEAALESLDNTFASSLEDTFMSIIDGSKSAGEAFRDMARQMIAEAMRMLVIRPMIQSLFGGGGGKGGGLFSGLLGGLFRRESGGSMMPNQPYLVGERGPELVIPGRSATVTNANLTERTMSGGQAVNVYQTINVSTGVQQTVRNEIKQLMPQIAESAKSAVVDAKRRGGSYGRAFSG